MDLSDIRSQFPILGQVTYLDRSATGPLSLRVREAAGEALATQVDGSLGTPLLQARVDALKQEIAALIGASPREIASVRSGGGGARR